MTENAPNTAEFTDFRPEARAPRGFADKRASQIAIERKLIANVSKVYEDFGFEALQTSAFEYADALGKFLPDADRPNVGVFSLQDDDEQWMALRYDHTAPLARFAAQNWETLPKPFRRYAFGPVWRNEKPGPGRLREFMQCDADTVGTDRPEADAEIIALAVAGFKANALPTVLRINNRKLLNGLLSSLGVDSAGQQMGVLRAIDKLERLGLDGVQLLLGGGRKDESGDFTKGAGLNDAAIAAVLSFVAAGRDASGGQAERGAVLDKLAAVLANSPEGQAGLEDLSRISTALTGLGVAESEALFDPSIVRGLEYYTGAVFEAELLMETRDDKGNLVKFGSVGGGGRYDDLVARFTGQSVPATGFSFGVSRLAAALALAETGAVQPVRGPIVIIAFSESDMGEYFKLAAEIRAAGLAVEVYLGRSGMKAQMKYADRRLSPAAVMLGGDELANGTVTIKDLDQGRELAGKISDNKEWREARPGQVTLPRAEAINHLKSIVNG
ncbi:histidine--tRNA ligase [Asticcacaulis sp. YBE204]|uniref:histidine--tRNA ligase n=1 Tax=Asticcacaulis sp. YBE204 TaxID=1282363 RepID=UPI0003C3D9EF|nr:histidine--tRNA ligase [Asticcacaulis sp. YBE204]ESQ79600.1 histidyl-tRNA synthetase [Asticcacaulis sp. YBE204]